jgi:hypothetical protein
MSKPNALESETRPAIPTEEAARLLCRSPKTLHRWACYGDGPIRPVRVHRRLMWPVEEIRRLLGGDGQQPKGASDGSAGASENTSLGEKKKKPSKATRHLRMVFRGTDHFTFRIIPFAFPEVEDDEDAEEVPGFEAVYTFRRLEGLQYRPSSSSFWRPFSHAQAICVTAIEDWDFPGKDLASVLVSHEAVRWVLCFRVSWGDIRRQCDSRANDYAPWFNTVCSEGNDVFYTFSSFVQPDALVQSVSYLDNLSFLSPQDKDKLVVIRARDWTWEERGDIAFIHSQDIIEQETISDSEVRVL